MTRNQAACLFWGREALRQARREAARERLEIARAGDCTEHVKVWELFEGLARLLGRERALAAWTRYC